MAYNTGFNPDRLPLHAEPEQAAAMLSGSEPRPPRTSSARPEYNKPPPQLPSGGRDGGYDPGRHDYDSRPPPGAYRDSYDDHRQSSSRYSPHQARFDQRPEPRFDGYGSPPPPQDYGRGPRPPPGGSYGREPPQRPPPTPVPPRDENDTDALWKLFRAVDKDRSGELTERELGSALVNGDWSKFDPHTVRMMIRMFDTNRSGTINFDEFCGLWGFLSAWRNLFDRFDQDRSGGISLVEFEEALMAFGYRLSANFIKLLFHTYKRPGTDSLSFDLFVQACISLKRMTDVFKKYDEDRDGYITLSFEEFLTGAQALFLFNSISAETDTGLY